MDAFAGDEQRQQFEAVCGVHSHVSPTEDFVGESNPQTLRRQISLLQQRSRALETELARRKKLETALRNREQDLTDYLENAVEGLHWVGPDGTIIWANAAELALLGYTRDEYVGHNIVEFHVNLPALEDMLSRLRRQESLKDHEARMRCKDGTIKHVLVSSNALFRDGEFIHTRCFTRDVTIERRLSDQLRSQNEELLRTVRFSEMFVGILGHDLRNPVMGVATAASLLLRRFDNEAVTKPARRIVNSAERMSRMIDQLLDFTGIRLGQGLPLAKRRANLGQLCRIAVEEAEIAERVLPMQVQVTGNPVGDWDANRLAQLVCNLVGNAQAHGKNRVLLRVNGERANEVLLEVCNGGVIDPELVSTLFEPFQSGTERRNEGSSGLGLGLYISEQIVLAHGGTISVASSEAEGTRFLVRLPRSVEKGAAFRELETKEPA